MKRIISVLVLIALVLTFPAFAFAADKSSIESQYDEIEKVTGSRPTFHAYPIFPEFPTYQLTQYGFYDLLLKPNQAQNITFGLYNETDEERSYKIQAITATTEKNGEINYTYHSRSDSTLKFPFASLIADSPKIVTVPPRTEIEVTMRLVAPRSNYEGVLLGALHITDVEEVESSEGIVLSLGKNLVVRLQSEANAIVAPDFKLANPELLAGRATTALFADIRCPVPALLMGVTVTTEVVGDTGVIFRGERQVDFAPNSIFPLEVVHAGAIDPGRYTAKIRVITFGGVIFNFEQNFNITDIDDEADDKIKDKTGQSRPPADGAELLSDFKWWYMLFLVLPAITLIWGIAAWRVRKNTHRKDGIYEYNKKAKK